MELNEFGEWLEKVHNHLQKCREDREKNHPNFTIPSHKEGRDMYRRHKDPSKNTLIRINKQKKLW